MADYPRICFDRILPRDLNRPQRLMSVAGGGPPRAIIRHEKRWVNGTTLNVRFIGGTNNQHDLVQEEVQWWTEHANLNFNFNNAQDAEIRVSFDPFGGAWSNVGTDCLNVPLHLATMNLGFLDPGTAAHEFGHAIGLAHEHQSPLNNPIVWNRDAVIRDLSGPPNNWTIAEIEHNVLNRYSVDQIRGTDFDRESIMVYFYPGTWTMSGIGSNGNDEISSADIAFIKSVEGYPPAAAVAPVELQVIETAGTSASIGVPGEEDLFKFTAVTSGRYSVQTGGQTDVMMRLFGPNSQTSLIGEDDDSGQGFNSMIVANLPPGEYFVQIRHYNTVSGTGSYSIKVTK